MTNTRLLSVSGEAAGATAGQSDRRPSGHQDQAGQTEGREQHAGQQVSLCDRERERGVEGGGGKGF